MGISSGGGTGGKMPAGRGVERWKRLIADNTRAAEMLESGEMRLFRGPGNGPEQDVSARWAKRLREISAMLQQLVDEHS
jgi:hypothetical protein